jgi:hypothetical protein
MTNPDTLKRCAMARNITGLRAEGQWGALRDLLSVPFAAT